MKPQVPRAASGESPRTVSSQLGDGPWHGLRGKVTEMDFAEGILTPDRETSTLPKENPPSPERGWGVNTPSMNHIQAGELIQEYIYYVDPTLSTAMSTSWSACEGERVLWTE